jgi:peptidoglycan/xylan/chitin deacetylase (PgdA/CDA1 family)
VVLCYHSVHAEGTRISSSVDVFERHVHWLTEHCRIVPLVELVSGADGGQSDRPTVAITFDDGYEDNHSYALPILLKHRVTATFFITAGFVERDPAVLQRFRHLLDCGPDDALPLDWAQVRELRGSGMDIGAHTYSHPNLARLPAEEAKDELRRSRDVISDRIGVPIDLLAYPFGKPKAHFTSTTMNIARVTGYRMAVAVTSRGVRASDSVLSIPRFFADGDSLSKLEAKVLGAYDLLAWWQEHAPLAAMRVVSPQDFRW